MNARGYGEFDWDGDELLFFLAAATTTLFTFVPLLNRRFRRRAAGADGGMIARRGARSFSPTGTFRSPD